MGIHDSSEKRRNFFALSKVGFRASRKFLLGTMGLMWVLLQPVGTLGAPPDHAKPVLMDGDVTMVHIDEIIPEKSRFAYFLHPKGSKDVKDIVEMIFEGEPPKFLHTGKKVKVRGKGAKGKVWVTEVAALDGDSSSTTVEGNAAAATSGDRKTVTFVINMSGVDYASQGASPYTQAHVDSSGAAMHDPVQFSVNSAYEEASFGQVTFSGSASTDVFLVTVPYDSSEACAYRTIASQADAASPVSLNGYHHKLYVVPPKAISGCGWLALGEVGSYGSTSVRKSWSTRIDPIAFAHELGHNIGWHHAATDPDNDGIKNVEYGDTSDLMGYCCSKRKLNSVHVDQVGWFDRNDLQDKIVDVTNAGQYTLAPLGTAPEASSDPQILRITPSIGRPYYLSYRQKTGKDSGMSSTYTTGVNIHRGEASNNWSYFVKVLKSDFSDPSLYEFYDAENNLTITQVENNANFVTVDISFGGTCQMGNTQVALTPSTQEVNAHNQSLSYTVMLTNGDTTECESSSYHVSLDAIKDAQGQVVPEITGSVQDSTVSVNPQGQGTTVVTLNVGEVENGPYTVTVNVSDLQSNEAMHDAQATGTVDVNVATCVLGVPEVSVTPGSQIISHVGQLQPYTVTVNNTDSSVCPPTNWTIGLSSSVPGTVTHPTLHLNPGTSGSTSVNMDVEEMSNGLYSITIQVADSDGGGTTHVAQADASLELALNTCVVGVPTVQLSPNDQMVIDASSVQPYSLKVTNNDNPWCQPSTWSISVGSTLGSTMTHPTLTLSSGEQGTSDILMQVGGAEDGTYPIVVSIADSIPEHAGQGTVALQLDLSGPTSPSEVSAQLTGKRRNRAVQVSWGPADDGSGTGVAHYVIYRNGAMLGSTTDISYKDANFSQTTENMYEVYAVDQVGHRSPNPGTVRYMYESGGNNPGGGNGGGKGKKK